MIPMVQIGGHFMASGWQFLRGNMEIAKSTLKLAKINLFIRPVVPYTNRKRSIKFIVTG